MLSATVSFSQVVYQSSDFATVGDSIHVSEATTGLSGFDFVQTGANHTWNYDSLPFFTQGDIKWIDPSTAGYMATWCLSNFIIIGCNTQFANFTNLATNNLDSLIFGSFEVSNLVEHFKKEPNSLTYKMLGGTVKIGGIPIIKIAEINDADTVYNFPLQFNDIDSCSSNYTIKISGDSTKYVSYYKRYNHVEGWGSLITPFKTFSSVLKIKTTIAKIDSIYLAGNPVQYIDTLIEFKWFDPAYEIPVLEVKANKIGQNIVTTGVTYIDSIKCVDPQAFFIYSPLVPYWDSISGEVDIAFSNLSANTDSVYWDFGDGSFSNDYNPNHTYNCPGTKIVKLIAVSKICNPFKIDTTQIPIIIQDTTDSYESSQAFEICSGDSVFVNGRYLKDFGLYIDTIQAVNGCDSIVKTFLTLYPVYSIPQNATICQGDSIFLEGAYQTTNGVYFDTLQTIHGCDSLITTTLTVNPIPPAPTISLTGNILSSNAVSGNQWYDQNGIITGAISQNYTVVTNGEYYDIVTLLGCNSSSSDTINVIITSVESIVNDKSIIIYPNPVSNELIIEINSNNELIKFEILNINGQNVFTGEIMESTIVQTNSFAPGVYLIKFENGRTFEFMKIIKQ